MGVEAWAVAWGKCLSLAPNFTCIFTLQVVWPLGVGLGQIFIRNSNSVSLKFLNFKLEKVAIYPSVNVDKSFVLLLP